MSNRIRKNRKRQKPRKRLDMTNMSNTLEGLGFVRGFFSALAIVQAAEDGGEHFDLDDEDLTVEVLLMPSETQLTVRVGTVAGGIWRVPPVGAEVLVAIPDGDIDFQPTICSWYSGGSMPEDVSETTLVISCPSGGRVFIHDGQGGVDQLVTKSAYEAHLHPTGTGPSGQANNALDPNSYTKVLSAK